ncbi:MAG TPA: hypothetical protein IAA55_06775 [Candidatus Pullilachnospira gallistercoris]|uniref:Uncharacterized protein n=1 Tax=Candidatus Pullilachnospira gallistercoris TaxID=2840911 RepID=A0A9D1JAS7_9FIRM|nr:hypothetical protein [Candidatus Pullilachnospira gallistercoris]
MDEKKRLSGADAEIQDHTEQGQEIQEAASPDFPALALFLANSYGQMLKDRERLKAVIDAGVPIYTREMAIRDLVSISIDNESDRVQTSNISNIPLRVSELLDNGYVEKMNRKLRREMDESVKEYGYLCWKIALVETAMRERMDKMEQAVFERMFAKGKSYRQVCKAYKKGTLHNKQVSKIKQRCLQAVANHLKNTSSFPVYIEYMKELLREWQTREE